MFRSVVLFIFASFFRLAVAGNDECMELARNEENLFNSGTLSEICEANPEDFPGLFIESGGIQFAVPSIFHLKAFGKGALRFSLRRDLVTERARYYSLFVGKYSDSMVTHASSVDSLDHKILQNYGAECRSHVELNRLVITPPGMQSELTFVEARVNDWLLRVDGTSPALLLAIIDTSRRLACSHEGV